MTTTYLYIEPKNGMNDYEINHIHQLNTLIHHKRNQLLRYINLYLSKPQLRMTKVMKPIRDRLISNSMISPKQFDSLIKWIEREEQFQWMNRSSIRKYFDLLIEEPNSKPQKEPTNDLTKFFN
jgi:hypothetical protein